MPGSQYRVIPFLTQPRCFFQILFKVYFPSVSYKTSQGFIYLYFFSWEASFFKKKNKKKIKGISIVLYKMTVRGWADSVSVCSHGLLDSVGTERESLLALAREWRAAKSLVHCLTRYQKRRFVQLLRSSLNLYDPFSMEESRHGCTPIALTFCFGAEGPVELSSALLHLLVKVCRSRAAWLKSPGLLLHGTGGRGTSMGFTWAEQWNSCGCTLPLSLYWGSGLYFILK